MLKIGSVRWKGRCSKHSGYDPETDGAAGIRGGCRRCEILLEIYLSHQKLVRLIREFGTRDQPKRNVPDTDEQRQLSLLE